MPDSYAVVRTASLLVAMVLLDTEARAIPPDPVLKLTPSDGRAGDGFGFSVAISNELAVVGAWESSRLAGAAYVFSLEGQQLLKLLGDDTGGNDNFGISAAISGDLVAIGARGNNAKGSDAGAVYVFDANTGQQLRRLEHSDLSAGDEFGFSLAMQGSTALVGAWTENVTGSFSGAAYLFDAATGELQSRLIPNDSAGGQFFGASVALSGTRAIIGAFGEPSGVRRGTAYVFDTETGDQLFKLSALNGEPFAHFGTSVAIDGPLAIVGAPDQGQNGAAYVYDLETGLERFRLLGKPGDNNFGQSVAIRGGIIAVGATETTNGTVYLFNASTGDELGDLLAPDGSVGDRFGWSLALAGDGTLLVGARNAGDFASQTDTGAAYIFFVPEPPTAVLCYSIGTVILLNRRNSR